MKSSKSLTIKTDISSDKKKEIFIKSYVELIKKLKFNNISPQEAHDLVIKNKFQTNKRYFWTLDRITIYLLVRWQELREVAQKILIYKTDKAKARGEEFLKIINSFQYNKKIKKLKKEGKIFSKRVDSCRKTVKHDFFHSNFKVYFPEEKFDERKELQNLQKLVSEKRHYLKFVKKNWKFYNATSDEELFKVFSRNIKKDHIQIILIIKHALDQGTIDFIK